MRSRVLCGLLVLLWLAGLSGCALCIGGAVGGAAGYEGAKRGYRVQSPVQKDSEGNVEVHSPVVKDKAPAE
jgi:hypothetical protein